MYDFDNHLCAYYNVVYTPNKESNDVLLSDITLRVDVRTHVKPIQLPENFTVPIYVWSRVATIMVRPQLTIHLFNTYIHRCIIHLNFSTSYWTNSTHHYTMMLVALLCWLEFPSAKQQLLAKQQAFKCCLYFSTWIDHINYTGCIHSGIDVL